MESERTRPALTWEPPKFDEVEWRTPDFEELVCSSEVTMYMMRMQD